MTSDDEDMAKAERRRACRNATYIIGILDSFAIGQRIGERHAQFDDIGASLLHLQEDGHG